MAGVAGATATSRGTARATLALVLFLSLAVGGVATWRYDLLDGRLDALLGGQAPADGDPGEPGDLEDPTTVAPPPGLDLPDVTVPDPVAVASSTGGSLDPGAVRRALAPYLLDPALGPHVRAAVAPLGGGPSGGGPGGGGPTFASGERPAIPASTTKVVTATAALLALGPERVFSTTARLGACGCSGPASDWGGRVRRPPRGASAHGENQCRHARSSRGAERRR